MPQLTQDQLDHFIANGYLVLKDCFTAEDIQPWVDHAWVRLGVDRDDPTGWQEKRVHLSTQQRLDVREFAPTALDAALELVGGPDRVDLPWQWGDGFIANLGVGDDRPWQPPSADVGGWHKDGDFFRHFLDSPEQGLLPIVLWTDMHHRGGGTFIAPDSIGVVARYFAEHPEGVLPTEIDTNRLIHECDDFVELTGDLGDVVLMHPYMLHATSQNVIQHGRMITNPPIALREPMQLDRTDPADFSPVELAVLRGLGVDSYAFHRTGEREAVVPRRVREQQAREQEEAARLAGQQG